MNSPRIEVPCPARAQSLGLFPILLAALLVAAALLPGCASRPPQLDRPLIADLTTLPQDAGAYLEPDTATLPLIPGEQQARLVEDYLTRHFAPWQRNQPENGPDKVFRLLDNYDSATFRAENKRQRPPSWIEEMRLLAAPESFPNAGLPAITTVNTDMRVLPTHRPLFRDFNQAGEGYPFDYNQNTAVWAQTPLFVSHISSDGAWALVETSTVYGWLPMRDIAMVDEAFMDAFITSNAVTFTADFVPVSDGFGLHRFDGRIGTLLPQVGTAPGTFDVLLAVRDSTGRAVLSSAEISADDAAPFPLEPTPVNFARLTNVFLGQAYGWGGMYGNRDCSAMVLDMFAPFGIWQPRNSKQQADFWGLTSLEGLDHEAKLNLIHENARPWLTLLWKPGHIMLYIGEWEGRPVILHTTWGLKTKVGKGYGRYVIGQTVITSLEPGEDLPDLARPDGNLLYLMRGMARVAPGEGN